MDIARDPTHVPSSEYSKVETVLSQKGHIFIKGMVLKAAGHITLEEFVPMDTITHVLYHTATHYVFQGEAEITYSMPPFHQKEEKSYAKAGDAYLIFCGERVTWKVTSDVPYRYICYTQPAPPLAGGEQLVDPIYEKYIESLFRSFKPRE